MFGSFCVSPGTCFDVTLRKDLKKNWHVQEVAYFFQLLVSLVKQITPPKNPCLISIIYVFDIPTTMLIV